MNRRLEYILNLKGGDTGATVRVQADDRRETPTYLVIGLLLTLLPALAAVPAGAQNTGEDLYQQSCAACHTIGGGRLVGPDLEGVTERREEDWLISFIRSSQDMIAAGDPVAVQLFEEFAEMPMPDQPYSADQVRRILDYIRMESGGGDADPVQAPAEEEASVSPTSQERTAADSAEAVRRGRELFVGRTRFADGGPTCSTCHTVDVGGALTGGALSVDLTMAYSRLSENGLRGIIANPPFPVMATAMGEAPTEEETADLVAFLRAADQEVDVRPGHAYSRLLFMAGFGGFLGLLIFAGAAWYRRARKETNHAIYARQISSH
ncbi:MAG: c-type cytochrome [Rhodothermales bacterium]